MIEDKQLPMAKETDDVLTMIVELIEDIKAGKSYMTIAGENLPNLKDALDGIDKIDDEYKEDMRVALATIGYRSGEIAGVLLKKKEESAE